MLSNHTKFYLEIKTRKLFLVYVLSILCLSTNAQSWQSLGTGVDFSVYALKVDTISDELYVGGWFTNAGGIPSNGIAKWDGTNWYSLNGGTNNGGQVRTIFYFNNEIYVGGSFDSIGGVAAKNIAKWNHVSWQSLGDGVNSTVHAISTFNGEIYAGGNFDSSGNQRVPFIARWDGMQWHNLNFGLNGPVYSMMPFEGELIIGGDFNQADTLQVGRIVKWTGFNWSPMGVGFNNFVRNFYIYKGELHTCGDFYYNAPSYIRYVARWDGSAWQALTAPGVSGSLSPGISDLIEFNGQLHITGSFTSPRAVARYAGITLDSLEHGLSWTGSCLAVYKGELVVGGYFAYAGNQVPYTSGLARWVLNPGVNEKSPLSGLIYVHSSLNTQTITLPFISQSSSFMFNLFDSQSRLIREIQVTNFDHIDIKNISPGIYIYRISTLDQGVYSGKLVIL